MQKIFWKQLIVCHRLEECYFYVDSVETIVTSTLINIL